MNDFSRGVLSQQQKNNQHTQQQQTNASQHPHGRSICQSSQANITFIGLFVLLVINLLSSLYISEISPLSDVGLVKIVSHSVGCCLSC